MNEKDEDKDNEVISFEENRELKGERKKGQDIIGAIRTME